VLFLCTGNYYRSRFAELLFNHQAAAAHLAWHAESRGIAVERGVQNRGPIALEVLAGLRARGIVLSADVRFPQQVHEEDFARADHIIALDETEHRPLLGQRFPAWVEHVAFWQARDVPYAPVPHTLALIEEQVHRLIRWFSQRTLTSTSAHVTPEDGGEATNGHTSVRWPSARKTGTPSG
jgi:protein-tyrosine phosphatase